MTDAPKARPDTQVFYDAFNTSPIGIAIETLEGQPLFVNPALCTMLGFSESELLSKHCVKYSPTEDAERDWQLFQQLRAGSIDHYQLEKRYFQRDGSLVWGRLSISLLKHVPPMVVAMVEDISEKKAAEEELHETNRILGQQKAALQESEELLKMFVKNVPAGVAMLDRDMHYLQVSDRFCSDYCGDNSQVLGRSHYEIFHDLPDRWIEAHRRALEGETLRADEDRWDRESGSIWLRWEVRPWINLDGLPGGILIFAEDITHRKQMEQSLSEMSRKLIESQEQERARIGRELHDDINQRLALLTVDLDLLQENPSEVQSRVQELQKQVTEISNDVQALSHELHSSKLEILGVVGGIKSFCREFAERQRMQIDFQSDVSSILTYEVGLCLFRVLQEALHNSVKHSGAKRIEVQLAEHPSEVHLTVSDLGTGFDIETARQASGLGLASMQERVRLVNGTIEIQSKSMGGTTILVCVPLRSKEASKHASG